MVLNVKIKFWVCFGFLQYSPKGLLEMILEVRINRLCIICEIRLYVNGWIPGFDGFVVFVSPFLSPEGVFEIILLWVTNSHWNEIEFDGWILSFGGVFFFVVLFLQCWLLKALKWSLNEQGNNQWNDIEFWVLVVFNLFLQVWSPDVTLLNMTRQCLLEQTHLMWGIGAFEWLFTIAFLMELGKGILVLDLGRFICTTTTPETGTFMLFVQV